MIMTYMDMANRNIFASIFGESPSTQQARGARDSAFQAMLNTRKQAAEQQRTDDVTMARYNALGNLLTTMVQPVGWAIGGGRGGATGGVQPYDDRQYISAFNRAVKAADDIRNIGSADAEYRFKLASDDYSRALHLEDEARRRQQVNDDYDRRRQIAMDEEDAREKARMERLQQEYELRTKLAEVQNAGKIAYANATRRGRDNKPPVDGRENGGLNGDGRENGGLTKK